MSQPYRYLREEEHARKGKQSTQRLKCRSKSGIFLGLNEEKIGDEFRKAMGEGGISRRALYVEIRTLAVALDEMRNHLWDIFW